MTVTGQEAQDQLGRITNTAMPGATDASEAAIAVEQATDGPTTPPTSPQE